MCTPQQLASVTTAPAPLQLRPPPGYTCVGEFLVLCITSSHRGAAALRPRPLGSSLPATAVTLLIAGPTFLQFPYLPLGG